jgi:galactokinase
VSHPVLDRLFAAFRHLPGVRGLRMTGAGFGGCVIMLADEGRLAAVIKGIDDFGRREFQRPMDVLTVVPADGGAICRGTSGEREP